jgi:hypothetical protein
MCPALRLQTCLLGTLQDYRDSVPKRRGRSFTRIGRSEGPPGPPAPISPALSPTNRDLLVLANCFVVLGTLVSLRNGNSGLTRRYHDPLISNIDITSRSELDRCFICTHSIDSFELDLVITVTAVSSTVVEDTGQYARKSNM